MSASQSGSVWHTLDSRQADALGLLLAGIPATQVAEQIGVSRRSICRWQALPEFRAEYSRLRAERFNAMVDGLAENARLAVGVIADVLRDRHADVRYRLRAAEVALRLGERNNDYSNEAPYATPLTTEERTARIVQFLEVAAERRKLAAMPPRTD